MALVPDAFTSLNAGEVAAWSRLFVAICSHSKSKNLFLEQLRPVVKCFYLFTIHGKLQRMRNEVPKIGIVHHSSTYEPTLLAVNYEGCCKVSWRYAWSRKACILTWQPLGCAPRSLEISGSSRQRQSREAHSNFRGSITWNVNFPPLATSSIAQPRHKFCICLCSTITWYNRIRIKNACST